jgi:Glycine transporter
MPLPIYTIQNSLGVFNLTVEIIATVAFAASGLIAAARKKLDVFGVCMVTGLTPISRTVLTYYGNTNNWLS